MAITLYGIKNCEQFLLKAPRHNLKKPHKVGFLGGSNISLLSLAVARGHLG